MLGRTSLARPELIPCPIEIPTENGVLDLELPVGAVELEIAARSLDLGPREVDITVPRSVKPTAIDVELR
ncbi:MAG: hypothetical protein GY711_25785 [bacterium]|nr:hypothetical protein [bacterium]